MTFKYFDRPDIFTDLKENEATCDFCGKYTDCFDAASFYGPENISAICPECLVSGRLKNKEAFTCSGDIQELKKQLKQLTPTLTDKEIEQQAKGKTEELEKTTPHLITWQDWEWPCADGDYCQFIGFGSIPFYRKLSAGKPDKEFFFDSIYYSLVDSDLEHLRTEELPEKEIRNYTDSTEYGTLFYVFMSLKSERIITIWDCN